MCSFPTHQLTGAKLFAAIVSSSKAVTAAMVDSVVDILSQAILALSDRYIARCVKLFWLLLIGRCVDVFILTYFAVICSWVHKAQS